MDSKQFYLEQFHLGECLHSHGSSLMSKLLNSVNSFSHNDAASQKSSYLSNRAPRFEEYTCDGDIATNENAAASYEGERHEALFNEVDNVEIQLTAGRALRERDGGDIDTNASVVLTVECANDAGNEKADNAPPTSTCNQRTPVAGSALCGSDHGGIDTNVSLASTSACANDVGNEESGNAPPTSTCDQRTPVVSLKAQGCQEKTRHVALSKKAAVDEEMPTSVCLGVQNSFYLSNETPRCAKNTCVDDIPTNGDAATSNDDSERCTATEEVNSMEIGLVVASTIRERGHDDITTNVSLAPTLECINDVVNEGVDNTSLLGCRKTPVAFLKSQACQEKHQHIPSNEKPSGPPKKQRSALEKVQGATRSPLTSPVSYAHESPLTRGRVALLSMSTPEALKLRKTRSGRVVVPTLDAGCQRIVYDMDGTIAGVIGLDSPSSKGSTLKTYARKRKAEPAAGTGSKLKTYARKKRRAE